MKQFCKKIMSSLLAFLFVFQITPISSFAMSNNQYEPELKFIEEKGLPIGEVVNIEELDEGLRFSVKYLPNDEISYYTYIEETNAIKIVINESDKQDTFVFKEDGTIIVNGERDYLFENLLGRDTDIQTYSRIAISTYSRFSDVPGYNYWRNQQFEPPINTLFEELVIDIAVGYTVSRLSSYIAAFFEAPGCVGNFVGLVQYIFDEYSGVDSGISSAVVRILNESGQMYNPMNLQYLYEVKAKAVIFNRTITDPNAVIYRLETYN